MRLVEKLLSDPVHVANPAGEVAPGKYPPGFLDRINSPEKLTQHLNRLLLRLILEEQPAKYRYHPRLKAAPLDWIMNTARDPETGYWGERYVRDGQVIKTGDVSFTYHIVTYLNGEVPD